MEFKNAFSFAPELTRTNNAGLAPYPTKAYEAIQHWNGRYYREGVHADGDAIGELIATRKTLAQFLGCEVSELAFMQSTAHAISQAAFGLNYDVGDEIVVWDQEYPSNFYPWMRVAERTGAKIIAVESGADYSTPYEKLIEAFTPRTKVVAISLVQYQTGAVTDIEKLAHETRARGIWLIVDGIQAIGARPFNFAKSGIDVLCGGSHKWLCSPLSTGFMVVKKDRIKDLEPVMVGAMTYGTPNDRPHAGAKIHDDGTRFEPGARSFLPLFGLKASVEVIEQAGLVAIAKECERLAARLRSGLHEMGFKIHTSDQKISSPIVTFSHGSWAAADIQATFARAKIGSTLRGPGVRVSPHAFNRDEEIETVLKTLRSHLPKR